MALTDIKICNRALARIGAPSITSFDDGSREAEVLTELYEHTYETVLTEAPWNFAKKDTELAQDATAPTDANYSYRYLLPSDYMNLVKFYSSSGTTITDYTIQGDYVLCNTNTLFVKYIYKPAENELPAWFTNYLVVKLAHDCTEAIMGIGSVQDRLSQEYFVVRATAYKNDNSEVSNVDALAPSTYVLVRN